MKTWSGDYGWCRTVTPLDQGKGMSHFTVLRVDVEDLDLAKEALEAMGYAVASNRAIKDFHGDTLQGDLVVMHKNKPLVALRKGLNGKYQFFADWWLVKRDAGVAEKDFINSFLQRYSYLKVRKEVQALGFRVINETTDDQGSIRVEVVKWR